MIKYSKQREAIKTCLMDREDHPTADMVYRDLRETHPNISLGTVYRNLSLLAELGEIQKFKAAGTDRFDARMTRHSHFFCKKCGCVLDIMKDFEELTKEVNRDWQHGTIEECSILFSGICSNCSK